MPGDLSLPGSAERLVARAAEELGGLDLLINNLGGSAPANKPFMETEPKDWRGVVGLNLYPAVEASRLAVPHFRRRGGGCIVMISSIYGRESGGYAGYNAVKSALNSLAKSLSRELAPDNVRVNAVAPGSILFPGGSWERLQQADPEGIADFVKRDLPAGHSDARKRWRRWWSSSARSGPAGSTGRASRWTARRGAPTSNQEPRTLPWRGRYVSRYDIPAHNIAGT